MNNLIDAKVLCREEGIIAGLREGRDEQCVKLLNKEVNVTFGWCASAADTVP